MGRNKLNHFLHFVKMVIFCGFFITLFGCISSNNTSMNKDDYAIYRAKKAGLIKTISGNVVQVNTTMWQQMGYKGKVGFALTCIDYIKKHSNYNSVLIECMYTHKTLAVYDDTWGFRLKD